MCSSSIGGGGGSDAGEQIENGFSRCGVAGSFERRRTKAFAGLFAAGCYPAAIFRPSRSAWKLQCAFGDTPICAKRARVYVRACARVRHVWVSTCAHDTAVPTCLPPPTHRRTSSSIASPPPLSFRPLNLLVPSFLPSTSPFPFPAAPKLEKDEEGRRTSISSTKYGCTCFRIPIFYVEYGVSKNRDGGCLTFESLRRRRRLYATFEDELHFQFSLVPVVDCERMSSTRRVLSDEFFIIKKRPCGTIESICSLHP